MGQQNSCKTNRDAFDHASHAPQLRSCNYYVHVLLQVFPTTRDCMYYQCSCAPLQQKCQHADSMALCIIMVPRESGSGGGGRRYPRTHIIVLKECPVGTQTRTRTRSRSDRKSIIKRPHTRNGRQCNMCHYRIGTNNP